MKYRLSDVPDELILSYRRYLQRLGLGRMLRPNLPEKMAENTIRQYSLIDTASGLVENSNRGHNGCGFNNYGGVAMVVYLQRPIAKPAVGLT